MRNILQPSRHGWRSAGRALLVLAWIASGPRQRTAAHDLFAACIQHNVHLAVGARHIDVTLDLTFFEEWSAQERRVMDADGNGTITRSERKSYQRKLAPQLAKQVKLRVAGRELPLILLYDPEIDLLANDQAGPAHHRLRISLFVATPADLRANDELEIEDRLWPEAKLLPTVQAEGRDECKLTTGIAIDRSLTPAQPNESRLFRFRCLRPPAQPAQPETIPARSAGKVKNNDASLRKPASQQTSHQ